MGIVSKDVILNLDNKATSEPDWKTTKAIILRWVKMAHSLITSQAGEL